MNCSLSLSPATQISYDKVESDLVDYLKTFLGSEVFEDVQARVDDLNQESRLCELILEVIYCAEKQMDRHSGMLDDIQEMIGKVRDMEPDGTNFRVGFRRGSVLFAECLIISSLYTIVGRSRRQVLPAHLRFFFSAALHAQEDHRDWKGVPRAGVLRH